VAICFIICAMRTDGNLPQQELRSSPGTGVCRPLCRRCCLCETSLSVIRPAVPSRLIVLDDNRHGHGLVDELPQSRPGQELCDAWFPITPTFPWPCAAIRVAGGSGLTGFGAGALPIFDFAIFLVIKASLLSRVIPSIPPAAYRAASWPSGSVLLTREPGGPLSWAGNRSRFLMAVSFGFLLTDAAAPAGGFSFSPGGRLI
jgi:hypothetical protein